MLTKLFTCESLEELVASIEATKQWQKRNDAKVKSASVTVSYQTDLGLLSEEDGPLVGVVYQGLEARSRGSRL